MPSIAEILISSTLLMGLTAGGMAVTAESLNSATDPLSQEQVDGIAAALVSPEFLAANGISQPVYECAKTVLAGSTEEDLTALINATDKVGTAEETTTQAALRGCIEQDPFGWAGTDQAWAIPLVTKYTKEGN